MHRCHDYPHLIARWREVARRAGLRLRRLALAGRVPLFYLITPALRAEGGLYLSAGIHGDEPGGTEGLLAWASAQGRRLRELPLFLAPCLNPVGLRLNTRTDAEGRDLNRSFSRDDIPELVALRRVVQPFQFAAAVLLHEDYDGRGLYLYEVQHTREPWGEKLVGAARRVIAIEDRARVDTWKAVEGVIRRRLNFRRFEKIGYPEAIWLYQHQCRRTFTVETPSEFALEVRARAHHAVLEEVVRLWRAQPAAEGEAPASAQAAR